MPLDFISLPPSYIAGIIYHFCDDESLLRMREVCKKTKEIVDDLVITVPTMIDLFNIRDLCGYLLTFKIYEHRDRLLWKTCLISLLNRLSLPISAIEISSADEILLDLRLGKLETFFEQFAALIKNAAFNDIILYSTSFLILSNLSHVLEGRPVHSIDFHSQHLNVIDLDKCLELVKKSKPRTIYLNYFPLKRESIKYLIEIASLVEDILIFPETNRSTLSKLPLSVTQDMLRMKCKILTLRQIIYSPDEVEKLIQFFNHLEKKVLFEVDVETATMKGRIGKYVVQMNNLTDRNTLWIQHEEFF